MDLVSARPMIRTRKSAMGCLVLDAKGVIFKSADDVAELLIPFISEKSESFDEQVIQHTCRQALEK